MLKRLLAAAALLGMITACSPFNPSGEVSDVRGRVFSQYFNAPLENAIVSIPNFSKNVRTDANGYFELRGIPTKWTEIEISHPNHQHLSRELHIEPFGAKYIEFRMNKEAPTANSPKIVFERNYDIWTSDIYGNAQKNLTGKQPRNIYRTYPVWSAKKDNIGYIAYEASQRVTLDDDGVWVMRADGTMPRKMTSVIDVGRIYHLDWSQDDNKFMFMLQDKIFVYNHRYGTQKSLSSALTRPSSFDNYNAGPVWTADGNKIVTTAYNVDFGINYRYTPNLHQIYIMDQQGGTRKQLTFEGDNFAPAVSHDGQKIAYISTMGGSAELWMMNIDGSSPEQITFMKANKIGQPRWDSHDQYVLFTSDYMQRYKSLYPKELWAVDTLTRDVHMVSNDAIHADG